MRDQTVDEFVRNVKQKKLVSTSESKSQFPSFVLPLGQHVDSDVEEDSDAEEFNSVDDEVMLYELKPKKNRKKFTQEEYAEMVKILAYAHEKLLQYFTICKSVWDMSYDATSIKLRKNKSLIDKKVSYVVYQDTFNQSTFVWESEYIVNSEKRGDSKVRFNLIYHGSDKTFKNVIKDHSNIKTLNIPIFEVFSSQNFPIESTLVPLFKRKIHTFFTQSL